MRVTRLGEALFLCTIGTAGLRGQTSPAQQAAPSKDVVVESLETNYRFENDGRGRTVQRVRIRPLTRAGRNGIAQIYFPYSSLTETLSVDYFRTVKADGKLIEADPAKALEVASPVSQIAPMFTDQKLKAMVAPDLDVGDALEYQFTRTIHNPLKPGDFWVIHFAEQAQVVQSEVVTLDVPADRKLSFSAAKGVRYRVEEEQNRKIYRWEVNNPEPRKAEDGPQPPLLAASTLTDWKQVGEWYLSLQSGRTEVSPEVRELAARLTAGKTTPREKLDAIYAYVSENIRYVGVSFGIGGYQPHAPTEVLHNGYGDCKDKHGLLAALLEAVGLKAYPVLVNSQRGVMEPSVPMPGQFDHVMSVVPLDGELLWMDTNLEVAPRGILLPGLRGKQGLLIEPGAIRLAPIPAESPVPEEVVFSAAGRLDPMGKLTLENHLSLRGQSELPYRQIFRLGNKQVIDTTMKALGQYEADDSTSEALGNSDPADLSRPFDFRFKVTKADFFAPLDTHKEMSVPHPLIANGLWSEALRKAEKARTAQAPPATAEAEDIDLGGQGKLEETVDLELGSAYQADLPLPIHIERPFAVYDSTYQLDQGHFRARRTLTILKSKLPAGQWQALESFSKLVDRDLTQNLALRRTGSVDLAAQADQMSADELNQQAASLLEAKKNLSLARDLLLKATAKDPHHKLAWNNLGRAYAALGSTAEAEKAYKKQIEINPNDEYAYKNLGWLYSSQRRYDEAVAAYRKHQEINPLDKDFYGYLAATLGQMGRWEEAAQAHAKDAALNHDKPEIYTAWGHALLKAGKVEEARQRLNRALELDSSPMTLNNVAYEWADAGIDLDQAERKAQQAVEAVVRDFPQPTSLDVPPDYAAQLRTLGAFLDTLGWAMFKKGQVAESEPYLSAAYQLEPNSAVAEHLAWMHTKLGHVEEAIRYYAYSQMELGWTGESNKSLEESLAPKAGGQAALRSRVLQAKQAFGEQRRLQPANRPFAYPVGATTTRPAAVEMAVLVDESGNVKDARVLAGEEPFRSAALQDAQQLRLPPLAWPGQALKSVRTVAFVYAPAKRPSGDAVKVFWGMGLPAPGTVPIVTADGQHVIDIPAESAAAGKPNASDSATASTSRGLPNYAVYLQQGALLQLTRNLDAAIEKYRQAIQAEPGCAVCHRALAGALAQKGLRAEAITEYRQVVKAEPDNPEDHFMLGAQLEAEAATQTFVEYRFDAKTHTVQRPSHVLPKSARAEYELALEEYRKACELAPVNTIYKEAYERVKRELHQP
jgi:tetratricopeptide (TPR) repeat protein